MTELKFSKSFDKIFNYTRKICSFLGLDVINPNFKCCFRSVIAVSIGCIGVLECFYTVYVDTIVHGNYDYLFKSGSIVGTGIQGVAKVFFGIYHQEKYRFMYTEIIDMYETYETKTSAYKQILKNSLIFVKKLMLSTFSYLCVTLIIFLSIPVFILLISKRRVEFLPFHIPILSYDTEYGFYITSVFHIICTILAGFGNFVSDSWLFVFTAHVPLIKNILQCKFDEFEEIVKANPRDASKSIGPLCDIFKWHQKYNLFCNTIKAAFFWIIFIQISTEFVGIVCSVVCMFLGIWPPASVFGFYLYFLIILFCSLGNLVESANDEITTMIYNCRWYDLTVPEQKMILLMLRTSQNSSCLSIGGVAPLSLNTALQLTKTIYTFAMMAMEYFA